jgi:hypothetical protein
LTSRARKAFFCIAFVYLAVFPTDAFAYLDPGTGSLFVQSLIAALAAVGYGLRVYWSRIRGWFKPPVVQEDPGHVSRPIPPA